MILIGELECTDRYMYPDGFKGFLWVGEDTYGNHRYNISTNEINAWAGDNFIKLKDEKPWSVEEFLQYIVDLDISYGAGVTKKFSDDVGIRLKGMCKFINRKPLNNGIENK